MTPVNVFKMICDDEHPWIQMIRTGEKTHEGRVYTRKFKDLQVGNVVAFVSADEGILCKVTSMKYFSNFREMAKNGPFSGLVPHIDKLEIDRESKISLAVNKYMSFPGAKKVERCGAVAIGVQYLGEYSEAPTPE